MADLMFQVAHEIDLATSGALEQEWTARQTHQAKMFAADVHIAKAKESQVTCEESPLVPLDLEDRKVWSW